jgi:hypothetical protein
MERLKITAHLKWGQVIYNDDFYFDAILYATKMKHTMSNYYNRERKQVNSK